MSFGDVIAVLLGVPFDRNPEMVIRQFELTSTGPHGATTRWTYTVPPGKKAYLESAYVKLIRTLAATTAGWAAFYVGYDAENSSGNIMKAVIQSNTVGDTDKDRLGGPLLMKEGDHLVAQSIDLSVAGLIGYISGVKITEFDLHSAKDFKIIEDQLPGPDVQQPGPRPDPVM
jgi:hypothetical protein